MANERVPLEVVRAQRLAAEAEQARQAEIAQQEASGGQQSGQPSDQEVTESLPQAQETAANDTVEKTPIIPSVPDINALLANLTPDQIETVRRLSVARGLTAPSGSDGVIAADGSMTVQVTITPELTEQLANWKEPTDVTLADTARRYIQESLQNYIFGDWTVPESVVAAPVTTGTGAAK